MECSSSGCDKAGVLAEGLDDPRVVAAAEKLAGLLVETGEYQAFVRTSRAVQFDQEVADLVSQLNAYPGFELESPDGTEEALRERVEMHPVMLEYRRAESAIRALLSAVNAAISEAAGLDFAGNAASAACG